VEVIYIHGRKAVMTIYEVTDAAAAEAEGEGDGGSEEEENWVEIEQIVLSDYETKVRDIFVILFYKGAQIIYIVIRRCYFIGGNARINGGKGVSKLYVHGIDIALIITCATHIITTLKQKSRNLKH
jgi:hypothetical protein